jgi:hypothetical protein
MQKTIEKPIEKSSMENLPTKRVLTVRERESLTATMGIYGYAETAAQGGYIPGASGASPVEVPWMQANRPRLNAQQKEIRKVLAEGTPQVVSGSEKDRLVKLAEELKEKFTDPEFFQTRAELRVLKRDKPEFFTALEKAHKWSKPQEKFGGRSPEELANAYRNIMRTLEPDDAMADSLDRLRKDR